MINLNQSGPDTLSDLRWPSNTCGWEEEIPCNLKEGMCVAAQLELAEEGTAGNKFSGTGVPRMQWLGTNPGPVYEWEIRK